MVRPIGSLDAEAAAQRLPGSRASSEAQRCDSMASTLGIIFLWDYELRRILQGFCCVGRWRPIVSLSWMPNPRSGICLAAQHFV